MSSLQTSDAEAGRHAVAPRVTLADIEGAIVARFDLTGDKLGQHSTRYAGDVEVPAVITQLGVLSICVLVMSNGFTIVGKSAPASPANFNAEFGKKLAFEDCIRQLWPLMGFSLRDRLAAL